MLFSCFPCFLVFLGVPGRPPEGPWGAPGTPLCVPWGSRARLRRALGRPRAPPGPRGGEKVTVALGAVRFFKMLLFRLLGAPGASPGGPWGALGPSRWPRGAARGAPRDPQGAPWAPQGAPGRVPRGVSDLVSHGTERARTKSAFSLLLAFYLLLHVTFLLPRRAL